MSRRITLIIIIFVLFVSSVAGAVSSGQVAEDSWVSKAPMHQARIFLGAAAVNGKIYAIGGNSETGITGVNEEYDPATDIWTYKTPMPTPRYFFGIAVYQNKIYCMGGKTGGFSAIGVNEVYDPATDTWQTLQPMPTARMNLQANVVNGKIYSIGGRVSDTSAYNDTIFNLNEVYDPLTDAWTTKTPIPQVAASIASAVVNNKIYAITPTLTMIYDPQNDSWSQGAPPPSGHVAIGGVTTGTFAPLRIYTFSVSKVLSYDPRTDSWTDSTSRPTLCEGPGLAVLDDKFYAIGGWKTEPAKDPLTSLYFSGQQVYTAVNEEYTPIGYGNAPPEIVVLSPENSMSYNSSTVSLDLTVNKPVDWFGYSLDGQENVTITGNTTIAGLSNGPHNLTIYANDTNGNMAASENIAFSTNLSTSFDATEAAVTIIAIAGVGGGLFYFLRRKRLFNV